MPWFLFFLKYNKWKIDRGENVKRTESLGWNELEGTIANYYKKIRQTVGYDIGYTVWNAKFGNLSGKRKLISCLMCIATWHKNGIMGSISLW